MTQLHYNSQWYWGKKKKKVIRKKKGLLYLRYMWFRINLTSDNKCFLKVLIIIQELHYIISRSNKYCIYFHCVREYYSMRLNTFKSFTSLINSRNRAREECTFTCRMLCLIDCSIQPGVRSGMSTIMNICIMFQWSRYSFDFPRCYNENPVRREDEG